MVRGRRLRVEVFPDHASYQLLEGEPLEVIHHGGRITVKTGEPCVVTYPVREAPPPISPPVGREPLRPGIGADAPSPER